MKITSLYFFFVTLLMSIVVSAKLTITITKDEIVFVFVPSFKEKVAFDDINNIIEENRNTYIDKEKFENKKKEFEQSNVKERFHNAFVKVRQNVKDQSVVITYVSPKILEKIKALSYVIAIERNNILNHDDEVKVPQPSKSNKPITIVRTTTIAKTSDNAKTTPVVTKTNDVSTTTQSNSSNATPTSDTNTNNDTSSKVNTSTRTDASTTIASTSTSNASDNGSIFGNGNYNTNNNSTLSNVVTGTNPQNSTNTQQLSSAQTHSIFKIFNLFIVLMLTLNLLF